MSKYRGRWEGGEAGRMGFESDSVEDMLAQAMVKRTLAFER
jgi:hypothetical protein